MTSGETPAPKTCARCGGAPAGDGGILCAGCKRAIETAPLYPEPDGPDAA
jgi:hypothetical protein